MHGTLRIFRTPSFDLEEMSEFINRFSPDSGEFHFLLTDGIMMNFRDTFPEDLLSRMYVQRILTSYQLQRILVDSDRSPYYIAVSSGVIDTWPLAVVEGIYDVMKIKSYYNGGTIFVNIVGHGGLFEKYLGNRILSRRDAGSNGGLYSWEERFQR